MIDCQYTPARGYMEIVNRQDRNALVGILNQRSEANSAIHSDEWRACINLPHDVPNCIAHDTVNHTYNFVNPNNAAHTQVSLTRFLKDQTML